MLRRAFSLQLAGLAGGTALAALGLPGRALAQNDSPTPGKDFNQVAPPAPTTTTRGHVEVVEFFWYACPHCNAFEPRLEQWVKQLPKDVAFRRSPVMFRDDFVPLQKLYYALEAMNKVDDMHRKVFNAIHVDRKVLNRDEPIINWVATQGIDKAKFTEAYNSFGVSTKVRKATQLQDAYKLAGVPAMGIAGKYYTDGTLAQSMDRALVVTDYLVAEQRGKAK